MGSTGKGGCPAEQIVRLGEGQSLMGMVTLLHPWISVLWRDSMVGLAVLLQDCPGSVNIGLGEARGVNIGFEDFLSPLDVVETAAECLSCLPQVPLVFFT